MSQNQLSEQWRSVIFNRNVHIEHQIDLKLASLLTNCAKNCPLQNDIHMALLNHNQLLCLCFEFKNTKDNQVSNKMPFPLTVM